MDGSYTCVVECGQPVYTDHRRGVRPLLGVRAVYAQVISTPEKAGIVLEFDTQVTAIANRDKSGFCPMETAVLGIDDPALAPEAIREKLRQLGRG